MVLLSIRASTLLSRSSSIHSLRSASVAALSARFVGSFSSAPAPIPAKSPAGPDPEKFNRTAEEIRRTDGNVSMYKLGKHRSNALELVHKVPIIEVEGDMAVCDGGGGVLGHPLEYISLARPGVVEYCKYCGLRYMQKKKETSEAS